MFMFCKDAVRRKLEDFEDFVGSHELENGRRTTRFTIP